MNEGNPESSGNVARRPFLIGAGVIGAAVFLPADGLGFQSGLPKKEDAWRNPKMIVDGLQGMTL